MGAFFYLGALSDCINCLYGSADPDHGTAIDSHLSLRPATVCFSYEREREQVGEKCWKKLNKIVILLSYSAINFLLYTLQLEVV